MSDIIDEGYEARIREHLQEFRDHGFKILVVVGESGSGKSSFCNSYTGHKNSDNPPFPVGTGSAEGTLRTAFIVDSARNIVWVDTRGLSNDLPMGRWIVMISLMGPINGLIVVVSPPNRASLNIHLKELRQFFKYLSVSGFYFLKIVPEFAREAARGVDYLRDAVVCVEHQDDHADVIKFIDNLPTGRFGVYDIESLFQLVLTQNQTIDELRDDKTRLQSELEKFQGYRHCYDALLLDFVEFWASMKRKFLVLKSGADESVADKYREEDEYKHAGHGHWLTFAGATPAGMIIAPILNEEALGQAVKTRSFCYELDGHCERMKTLHLQIRVNAGEVTLNTLTGEYREIASGRCVGTLPGAYNVEVEQKTSE